MADPEALDPPGALRLAVERAPARGRARAGTQTALAGALGVRQAAVSKWLKARKWLPAEHVLKAEESTGVSRHLLRPDLYPVGALTMVATIPAAAAAGPGKRKSGLPIGEPVR